jgi:hypothetical protein
MNAHTGRLTGSANHCAGPASEFFVKGRPQPPRQEIHMFSKKLAAALVVATAVAGLSAPVRAQEGTQDDFMILFKMQMIDKNKDGMVSKKEFIAMMDKAYDMKAKAMGAKGGLMSEAQMREFLKSLYTGG